MARLMEGVHPAGDREVGSGPAAGGDHPGVVELRVRSQDPGAGAARLDGGGQRQALRPVFVLLPQRSDPQRRGFRFEVRAGHAVRDPAFGAREGFGVPQVHRDPVRGEDPPPARGHGVSGNDDPRLEEHPLPVEEGGVAVLGQSAVGRTGRRDDERGAPPH